MHTITLSNHKSFAAEQEKSLLDNGRSQNIILEYSCRTGRCGICKAKLLKGTTTILQEELALTETDSTAGYILTCCRAPSSDIELDIEDLGQLADIKIKTVPCRVDSIELMSEDIVRVLLRTPPASTLFYLSGQYIDIIGKEGIRRSYSIANAQRDDGKLELHIKRVYEGVMSQYWFNQAQVNDLLRLEGPLGTFCLRNSAATHLVFLATGTGIAPVKAILETLALNPNQLTGKYVHVYWGGRTESDIYWRPELPGIDMVFTPVLSRAPIQWSGRRGHVHNALIADAIELSDAVVYACGSEAMIHSAHDILTTAGLPVKNFYSDAFVSSN
ncbi:FAD-binding oxidoreductase [Pseudomonas protegens]|uniref:FAD-binding oxidoreductase n=1 Tax=Pseudomonas protegens TaxID=380021 RepID=UPI00035EC7C6|nr:FAD-binding oxidoreductase [Pseudomonas protegens]